MTLAIFLFGIVVSGIALVGILSIGVSEAADPAHGQADDAYSEIERKVSEHVN